MSQELACLLQDLRARGEALSAEALPAFIGELEALKTRAWVRLMAGSPAGGNGQPEAPAAGDRLLTVEEAAQQLGLSRDYLYRHAKTLPFTVRVGPRQLRFSLRGIERYIRQRAGR